MEEQFQYKGNYYQPIIDKFFQNIRPPNNEVDDCWEWIGALNTDGYGMFNITINNKLRRIRAHRFSYEIHVGPIPNGLSICHRCDNPICVNPEHLFPGTLIENNKDRDSKMRHTHGSRNYNAVLNEENIKEIINGTLNGKYKSINDILTVYNKVKRGAINHIINEYRWLHVIKQFSETDMNKVREILTNRLSNDIKKSRN